MSTFLLINCYLALTSSSISALSVDDIYWTHFRPCRLASKVISTITFRAFSPFLCILAEFVLA